jgi:hypothetical protein
VTKKQSSITTETVSLSTKSQLRAGFFVAYFHLNDKYMMHTYQASVRAQVKGRSQVIKTEVRAMNAQEARWLLWAQWGFHSIQSGPSQIKNKK